jgi:hypothetical protein
VDVNADITLLRATSLVIAKQIIAATEQQLGIRQGAIDRIHPNDFVMFCMPDGSMFTAAKPPGPPLLILVTGLPFPERLPA